MSRHASSKPVRDAAPAWVPMLPREAEAKVVELAKEGKQPAVIGLILRDSYGIPSVHELTGKKIAQIMKDAGVSGKLPQDLQNLIQRSIHLQEHLAANSRDLHNMRGLELMEARIRGLAKYYQGRGELPGEWNYTRGGARLLVD
ncbi:MAG TPA: 30S ribosomal protein S15 [Candidatus Thermoplasmatota archaeon]|jgi:small subunit ribosomal protein S15|nr:30S ribosomal protein S15 [Candidatus Thermoplasmatota archaeon]